MDGFLFETCALSALLDEGHPIHAAMKSFADNLDPNDWKYVSSIALSELRYGAALYELREGHPLPKWPAILARALAHEILDVTRHTSIDYAQLKTNVASKYLKDPLDKKERKRWIENWIDKATGQALAIDENDLWMCAQARERNLVLLTTDQKIQRIGDADPILQLKIIK